MPDTFVFKGARQESGFANFLGRGHVRACGAPDSARTAVVSSPVRIPVGMNRPIAAGSSENHSKLADRGRYLKVGGHRFRGYDRQRVRAGVGRYRGCSGRHSFEAALW